MSATFVIEHESGGFRYRLRRHDGCIVVEGPLRSSERGCLEDVHELKRLVAGATIGEPARGPRYIGQALASSP